MIRAASRGYQLACVPGVFSMIRLIMRNMAELYRLGLRNDVRGRGKAEMGDMARLSQREPSDDQMLQEQIAYYDARAGEYDEWFLRRGRYDRGPELNRKWFDEVGQVTAALDAFLPRGQVLELACGTGLWTQRLVRYATHVTAVDSSENMLALNRTRVGESKVDHVKADIFAWRPDIQ